MKNTLLTILIFTSVKVCFSQYYKNQCDLIQTCGEHEQHFNEKISKRFNRLNSDSAVVIAEYGGVGCHTTNLLLFYLKNGSIKVEYYIDTERQKGINLKPEHEEHLLSFFSDKLYIAKDTVADKYLYIDDGFSRLVLYRVGDYCGSYHIYPEYNKNKLYEWVIRAGYPRVKK